MLTEFEHERDRLDAMISQTRVAQSQTAGGSGR
jgi:hypothetical protein